MSSEAIRYLIVPGWQGSADDHWQSHWQRSLPNSARVEQQDWEKPNCADWLQALEQQVGADPRPAILIAHSLGCVTVARWAAIAPVTSLRRVRGALLVAPADVERAGCSEVLRNFAPIPRHLLPFPSQLVSSDNDPAVSSSRAIELARDWGSEAAIIAGAGHINVKSGHQRWEQGFAYLFRLQSRIEQLGRRRA